MADQPTSSYYEKNADIIFEKYESVSSHISEYFNVSFPAGCKILDIGCGSGRDLKVLINMGFDAYGLEPNSVFRGKTVCNDPDLKDRIYPGSLPNLAHPSMYDGVLCSAVFMHIPKAEQVESLISIRKILNPSGRLLISVPGSRPGIDSNNRDKDGRLFEPMTAEQLILLTSRLGFKCLGQFENNDSLGRDGVSWITVLFEKSAQIGQPLDRIESVIRNDNKVATYKLALMRAFCDIADRDERAVSWSHSQVGIPVNIVAELWLKYYWHIVANPFLIPQNNAEAVGGRPIAFRKQLAELQALCKEYYQDNKTCYSLFLIDWKKSTLPVPIEKSLVQVLQKIRNAIVQGPVKYSGAGEMFYYDSKSKLILVDSKLWIEFCLTGYWIKDSLLLRWAELTINFGTRLPDIDMGVVLNLLLSQEDIVREQRIARTIYLKEKNLHCVWSDKTIIKSSTEIDHALPFAIFRNNDLWNLFPAHHKINNKKRDKIPCPYLIRARKDAIINCWVILSDNEPELFASEIKATIGRFDIKTWESDLFIHLKSKAEHAVYSRGLESWNCES